MDPYNLDGKRSLEDLIHIADSVFSDNTHLAGYGISLAAAELRKVTNDEKMIRAALVQSTYGTFDILNLKDTFELF